MSDEFNYNTTDFDYNQPISSQTPFKKPQQSIDKQKPKIYLSGAVSNSYEHRTWRDDSMKILRSNKLFYFNPLLNKRRKELQHSGSNLYQVKKQIFKFDWINLIKCDYCFVRWDKTTVGDPRVYGEIALSYTNNIPIIMWIAHPSTNNDLMCMTFKHYKNMNDCLKYIIDDAKTKKLLK